MTGMTQQAPAEEPKYSVPANKTSGGKNKSLTLDQRRLIQKGIELGYSKVSIAQSIEKDKSTVGKEIKLHRQKVASSESNPLDCTGYATCKYNLACDESCEGYKPFVCRRRDRTPGACNGCTDYDACPYAKYWYDADDAHESYKELLVESRRGINMSPEEVAQMWEILKPCLEKKMSIAEIVYEHPELGVCQKTLYNYLNNGVFPVDRKGNLWSDVQKQQQQEQEQEQ